MWKTPRPGGRSGTRRPCGGVTPSMRTLGRLALLFVIVPVVELVLLIQIGQVIGLLPTLLLVVGTGVTGAYLARLEGLRTLWKLRADLARGKMPGQALMDGVSILIGGAFLLTPGVLTDLLGFSLLLPFSRRAIQKRIRRRLEKALTDGSLDVHVVSSMSWSPPHDSEM